jgi:hypothetical protein
MIKVVIRTCKRDDYLAALCYESFKAAAIEADYSFLAEHGEYQYITQSGISIKHKGFCDNYGGTQGAKAILHDFKQYSISNDDIFVFSDSDIIVRENFTNDLFEADHSGIMNTDHWNLRHVSGQMQIFKGSTFNKIVSLMEPQINLALMHMVNAGIAMADDTFLSFLTDSFGSTKKHIQNKWIHYKAYDHTGNMNYLDVIKNVKDIFPI